PEPPRQLGADRTLGHALILQEQAVDAAVVEHPPLSVSEGDGSVRAADELVLDGNLAVARPPDAERLPEHEVAAVGRRAADHHPQQRDRPQACHGQPVYIACVPGPRCQAEPPAERLGWADWRLRSPGAGTSLPALGATTMNGVLRSVPVGCSTHGSAARVATGSAPRP